MSGWMPQRSEKRVECPCDRNTEAISLQLAVPAYLGICDLVHAVSKRVGERTMPGVPSGGQVSTHFYG